MRNHYFSFKLFLQGLRLIRLPGLILGISTIAFSLVQAIFGSSQMLSTTGQNTLEYRYLYLYNSPIAVSIFTTVGPLILTLMAFSFLRKRRASDFYHSIPANRICLFLSYTLSVITWIFVIILMGSLASSAVYVISGALPLKLITGSYLLPIVKMLCGSLFVTCCTLLVMSITSTLFSNLFMTFVLLYLPSYVVNLYTNSLASSVSYIIPFPNQGISGALSLLIYPFQSIFSLLDTPYYLNMANHSAVSMADWESIAMKGVLTLLCFALALLLFAKRKSEMAGYGASAPLLQHICRVAVTLPFIAYYPVAFLSSRNYNLITLITLGTLAFLVYFSYELIATRRFTSLMKAAPVFLVVVGLAAIGSFGLSAAKNNILSFSPTAEQVKSIQMTALPTMSCTGNYDIYDSSLTSDIQIKDETAKKIVCDGLKGNLNEIKVAKNSNILYMRNETTQRIKVEFHAGLFSKTRNIAISNEEFTKLLLKCSETNEKFSKAMKTMPKDGEITSIQYYSNKLKVEKEDALALYQVYRDECKSLSVKQLLSLQNDLNSKTNLMEDGQFSIHGQSMAGDFSVGYCLSSSLTPKTCAAVKNMEYKKALMSMPKEDEIESISYCGSNLNVEKADALALYKIFCDECKSLSPEQLLKVFDNSNIMVSGNFSITGKRTGGNFSVIYYVSSSQTPKTYAATNGLQYKKTLTDLQKVLDHLNNRYISFQFSNSSYYFDYFYNDPDYDPNSNPINGSSRHLTTKEFNTVKKLMYGALNRMIKSGSDAKDSWQVSTYFKDTSQNFSINLSFTDSEIKTLVGIANQDSINNLRAILGKADNYGLWFQFTNDLNPNLNFSYKNELGKRAFGLTYDELTKVSNILYKAYEHANCSDNSVDWNVNINLIDSGSSGRFFAAYLNLTGSDVKYLKSLDQKYKSK